MRLADWLLAGSGGWRFARACAAAISAMFTLAVVYLALRGQGAQTAGVVGRAAIVIAWIAGMGVAWSSAADRASMEQAEGWMTLARCQGLRTGTFGVARASAAALRLALLVLLAVLPVAIASIAASPSWQVAAWRLTVLAPLTLFAACVGLVGGALASACGVLSPRHGRGLLAAIVLVPWALDGVFVTGRARVGSLPGLLGFVAELASQMGAGV